MIYGDNVEVVTQSNQNVHAEYGGESAGDCCFNGIADLFFREVIFIQESTGNHGRISVL